MSYNIICVDDEKSFLLFAKTVLEKDYNFKGVETLAEGLQVVRKDDIDLVLLDITLKGGENGMEGLRQIKQISPDTEVIMVTGLKNPKLIVQALHAGAANYLCKPIDEDELRIVVENIRSIKEYKDRHKAFVEDINRSDQKFKMLGTSPLFRQLLEQADRLKGKTDANVLICGESGTGKELLARYIHSLEGDKSRPFIAVNCAAIPEGLVESELFGHERGAFTSAVHRKIGKFEMANGGDIFLDEISSLKPEMQAKILRVIQEKEIVRVGGNRSVLIEFRVIAATNENLSKLVKEEIFRTDLYHRLRVVELSIPPLRKRKEDIAPLTTYFLNKFKNGGEAKIISPQVIQILQEYSWPGNIRELENVIHSLSIMSQKSNITEADLPEWLIQSNFSGEDKGMNTDSYYMVNISEDISVVKFNEFIKKAEKAYIDRLLKKYDNDKTKTAEAMNISRSHLYVKLKELDLIVK